MEILNMKKMALPIAYTFALLFFFASANTNAQSPRMSLIEEGTNASCAPCAAQNPTFEAYLAQSYNKTRAIPIVFHAYWPGKDVMHDADSVMNNRRVMYHGYTGVPMAVVNGKIPAKSPTGGYAGAPADTVGISTAIMTAAGTSPITITIDEQASAGSVTVNVQVTSTTALVAKKIRIAVVEGHHYYASAGTNGEKDFYYIARKMLPSFAGEDLSLNANETKTFTNNYTVDAGWNANEVYVVAWVQDDVTKDVLQAATNKLDLELEIAARTKANSTKNQMTDFAGTLNPGTDGEYTVTITTAYPAGWTSSVSVNGTPVINGGTVQLKKGDAVPFVATIIPADGKNRVGSMTVAVNGPRGASFFKTFKLYSQDIDVLCLVKDEGDTKIATNYTNAFELGTLNYAMVVNGEESYFDLNAYRAVVVDVGKNVLVKTDVDLLKSYIDKGGRLYMIGAEIGWGLADTGSQNRGYYIDTDFLKNYLHADYILDDNPSTTVKGITGDFIGNGLSFSITNGVQNQDTPDQLAPLGGAETIFYYGSVTSDVAGIKYADAKNRLVFLGFGIEGIGNLTQRAAVLNKGIAWLLGISDAGDGPFSIVPVDFTVFPNPSSNLMTIRFNNQKPEQVSVRLYNELGALVAPLLEAKVDASSQFHFNTAAYPSGVYRLTVNRNGETASSLLHIVH
jgi:hypothetical protein